MIMLVNSFTSQCGTRSSRSNSSGYKYSSRRSLSGVKFAKEVASWCRTSGYALMRFYSVSNHKKTSWPCTVCRGVKRRAM